jgi:hypothetical protein
MWVKRGTLGVLQNLFSYTNSGLDRRLSFAATDALTYGGTFAPLYRDPAAWYHIVVSCESGGTLNCYVNGILVGAASSSLYTIPSGTVINLGRNNLNSNAYFDGEMAEINFVDGQALAPTAFGASSIYNQWLPIAYAGTYGTNGFYLPFSATSATSYAGSFNGAVGTNVNFDGGTPCTLGSGNFTIETWVNFNNVTTQQHLIDCRPPTLNGAYPCLLLDPATVKLSWYINATIQMVSAAISANSWYHVAIVRVGPTTTMYVNGVSAASFADSISYANSVNHPALGGNTAAFGGVNLNGFLSNFRIVKGTAVYTANFTPPTSPLTAISGTSLLTFQNATIVDNSTNAFTPTNVGSVTMGVQYPFVPTTVLTADSSGNGNNWTPNNISLTAGSTYDSLTDVPTLTSTTVANYCVINPLSPTLNSGTISNGNLKNAGAFGGSGCIAYGTIGVTSGKFYFEVESVSNAGHGQVALGIYTNNSGLVKYSGDGGDTGYTTYGTYGVAFDVDAGKLWYRNTSGSWVSGDPATGASPTSTFTVNLITFPYSGTSRTSGFNENGIGNWNYGQQPFTYTAPTGFLPLNTFNI